METGHMTDTNPINIQCPVCEKTAPLHEHRGITICKECCTLAETLITKQEQIVRIKKLATTAKKEPVEDLPDVLDAVRYRTRDREQNTWYVSISEMAGEPVEIFASTAFDRDQHLQSRISNLTTITRLISLILRHISIGEELTLEKTLTQLRRSSRQKNDLPDMLAKVLSNYTIRDGMTPQSPQQTKA
jgi:hypothetical protein